MVDHIPAHRYSNPGPFPPAHHHFQGYFNLILSEKHRTPSGTTGRNNTVKASENIYTNRCFNFHTLLFPPNAQKQSTKPSFPPPDLRSASSATTTTMVARRRQVGGGTAAEPPSPDPSSPGTLLLLPRLEDRQPRCFLAEADASWHSAGEGTTRQGGPRDVLFMFDPCSSARFHHALYV